MNQKFATLRCLDLSVVPAQVLDGSKGAVGALGPFERFGNGIVMTDQVHNVGAQSLDAMIDADRTMRLRACVKWKFTTKMARAKMARAYPKPSPIGPGPTSCDAVLVATVIMDATVISRSVVSPPQGAMAMPVSAVPGRDPPWESIPPTTVVVVKAPVTPVVTRIVRARNASRTPLDLNRMRSGYSTANDMSLRMDDRRTARDHPRSDAGNPMWPVRDEVCANSLAGDARTRAASTRMDSTAAHGTAATGVEAATSRMESAAARNMAAHM